MLERSKTLSFAFLVSLLGGLGVAGCSENSTSDQPFALASVSVSPSEQDFQLNRAIEFRFNRPVDPLTVSQNTINIAAASGETVLDRGLAPFGFRWAVSTSIREGAPPISSNSCSRAPTPRPSES